MSLEATENQPGLFGMIWSSPFLWGAALTCGVYSSIPYLPQYQDLAQRYLGSHPLAYATTYLFLVGMTILVMKLWRCRQEKLTFELNLIEQAIIPENDSHENAQSLQKIVEEHVALFGNSQLLSRLRDVSQYLLGTKKREGLEEHLKYLADLSFEKMQRSFGLVRTITWAVPILGFLGTVIGITVALANVNLEQIQAAPDQVANGLAIAFDTTALALTLSMILVFGSYVVEQAEQNILAHVEEVGINLLVPVFAENGAGLMASESLAAQQLLQQTEMMIQNQTGLWNESLDQLRGSWLATTEQQKQQFDDYLSEGMSGTLSHHGEHLQQLRAELVSMVENLAGQVTQQQHATEIAMKKLMESFLGELNIASEQIAMNLKEAAGGNQEQLLELRKQEELLLKIVSEEENLTRLQERLSDNLEAVRTAEAFEETLHSLTAAVHMLTARASKSQRSAA